MRHPIPFCLSLLLLVFSAGSYSLDELNTEGVSDEAVVETITDAYTDTAPDAGAFVDAPIDDSLDDGMDSTVTPDSSAITSLHPPLKALILTSPGVYHNYERQTWDIGHGIVERANVRFDVSLAEPERWKTTDYSMGYDVLIYNLCMADNKDAALIANMRRQTEELGVPAVFIHCTMHSFRETDLWWPLLGLKSKEHEPERALRQIQHGPHPILTGIPEDWVLPEDELYLNLEFVGQSLLSSVDEAGNDQVTAWVDYQGLTPVFGTTLGHTEATMKSTAYQQMLANAVLFVTGNLSSDGKPTAGMGPMGDGMDIFGNFSAPEGVKFLGQKGQDCAMRKMAIAAAPCYLSCILDPFEWGAATRVCKQACEANIPSPDELIKACMPTSI